MSRRITEHPTQLELEILTIVWRDGSCTVRHVRDTLASKRDLAFTSVLTTMKIMVKKGYLSADFRPQREGGTSYSALVAKGTTGAKMFQSLARRLFGGTIATAFQSLLHEGAIDQKDIEELRDVLHRKRGGRRK